MIIMHGDIAVAGIGKNGIAKIFVPDRMPYDLYFEEKTTDIDSLVQNLENFYHWCSTRLIHIDRKYIKEIFGSIGATQQMTDRDRAQIALSYHALSLLDIYWVRDDEEQVFFSDINLYEHSLSNAFADLSLRGRSMSVENNHLIADDLSTPGMFPKAWIREEDGFYLIKDGDEDAVERELLASRIAGCFDVPLIQYEESIYDDLRVSRSKIITSLDISIVSMDAFLIYTINHDLNCLNEVLRKDSYGYYMMNIIDYLVGNTDRHKGNWGWLVDNQTGERLRLHELMDFNKAFNSYDTTDGAICQTVFDKTGKPDGQTQYDAAKTATRNISPKLTTNIDDNWFGEHDTWREMFHRRMDRLFCN
ncbi:MAG: hypothetical protein J6P16_03920 [Eubacterium sp.]|nr:hypothetical protein [Eubacterium sp.]